jgi:hypothetical protein
MELQNDRVINGLLKADLGFLTPEEVNARLAQDVAIQVDPARAKADDLWPCVWFLASALERQFTGRVLISVGIPKALPGPIPLGPRCQFLSGHTPDCGITVNLGKPASTDTAIMGDARGNQLSYGRLLSTSEPAHPITCCALAGYLGFAALAHAVGIPGFREDWRQESILLPFDVFVGPIPSFSVLGTGQVGQAFLALTYFLATTKPLSIHLLDKDPFEDYNQRTQILLSEDIDSWCGKPKVDYLADICRSWGWTVLPEQKEIKWGWKHGRQDRPLAFLGFDNMDARRIAVEGGFPWLFECGVGTNFCQPRITWHAIPPQRQLAKMLFKDVPRRTGASAFATSLSDSPAECGRVVFENIDASAPSLGLVAVAATWAEIMGFLAGDRQPYSGSAFVWSPLLPILRESLSPGTDRVA